MADSKQREPGRRRPHRRNPEANRAAILDAAREVFTECGYARGTIREIARRAGVTHGLVMRHFPTKEQLLLAAVPGPRDAEDLAAGDPATLPERLAASFVDRMEAPGEDHALIALIRSAASGEAVAMPLLRAMEEQTAAAYRGVLVGEDIDIYVDLIGAQLMGITLSRYIVGGGWLSELSRDELVEYLGGALRGILTPVLPSPAGEKRASPG